MTPELNYLQENQMLNRLRDASSDHVKNAFMANFCATLVLLKMQDLPGLHLINDPSGATDLTKFKSSLSDLNFWARILFHPTNPAVKQRMQFGHAELLAKDAGRISSSRVKEIVKLPMKAPNQINWQEVVATLYLLRERFNIRSTYFNNMIRYFFRWDGLFGTAQKKAINDSFMYLLQSDPKSALLSRLRSLSNSALMNTMNTAAKTIIGFKRLSEEDGGGGGGESSVSTGEIASNSSPITNSIITPPNCESPYMGYRVPGNDKASDKPTKKKKTIFKDGKIIKKKVKGFTPRKYKSPDHIRPKKIEDSSDTSKTTFKDVAKDTQ